MMIKGMEGKVRVSDTRLNRNRKGLVIIDSGCLVMNCEMHGNKVCGIKIEGWPEKEILVNMDKGEENNSRVEIVKCSVKGNLKNGIETETVTKGPIVFRYCHIINNRSHGAVCMAKEESLIKSVPQAST